MTAEDEPGGRRAPGRIARRDPRDLAAATIDFAALRDVPVGAVENGFTRGERRRPIFGGRRPDLFDHVNELRSEFAGRSELLVLHAGFVVALRRRLADDHFLPLYQRLWRDEGPFLLRELSLRWLVSACDTLVDHGVTPAQRAVALTGTVLANLVKLAETERRVTPGVPRRKGGGAELFDGLTVFKPGGDMLRNLFRRIEATAALDDIAGPILQEIARRVQRADTVVRRLAAPQPEAEAPG